MSMCFAITGLPFAFLHLGFMWGFLLLCFFAYLSYKSCLLYLKLKEVVPARLDSLQEVGYITMGRSALFVLGFATFFLSFCLVVIQFIVFADISKTMVAQYITQQGNIFNTRFPYILFLAVANLPFALKRELTEIKLTQVLLFFGACMLIVMFTTSLVQTNTNLSSRFVNFNQTEL